MIAGGELGQEDVRAGGEERRPCSEVRVSADAPSDHDVSGVVDGDTRAVLNGGDVAAEVSGPQVRAGGRVLGEEDVPAESRQRSAAEVDAAAEVADDDDVVRSIHRDSVADVGTGASEPLRPHMPAGGGELRYEDVPVAGAGQRAAAEVDTRAHEAPRENEIGVAISGDRVADIEGGASEPLRPYVGAGGGQLDDEDVRAPPPAGEGTAAEVHGTDDGARGDDVAAGVESDGKSAIGVQAPETLRPQVLTRG